MIITGAREKLLENPSYYKNLLTHLPSDYENPYIAKIELDVNRSFPHKLSLETKEESFIKLRNILQSFTIRNPTLGYCQGFNIILARLLETTDFNEEESFWLLVSIIEDIFPFDFFMNSAGLETDCDLILDIISKENDNLIQHLTKINSVSILFSYIMKWLISLFITGVDEEISNIIMDLIFLHKNINPLCGIYNCTYCLMLIMKNELLKADSIENVGAVFTNYLKKPDFEPKEKEKIINKITQYILNDKSKFSVHNIEFWKLRNEKVDKVFESIKRRKISKVKEIQQEEDKWKSILEKECNLDWPICAKDVGYKWDVEHFLLYSNRLENKGRVYVDNYFFDQCSKPNNTDLYNPNHDNNLNIFKSLNIERKKHLCKK